jgi:beta-N-acetylhexosaminidase
MKKLLALIICLFLLAAGCGKSMQPPPVHGNNGYEPLPGEGGSGDMPSQDKIREILFNMTLEEKVGQMVIAGFTGIEPGDKVISLIRDQRVGGLIFFGRNISNEAQLKALVSSLREINEQPGSLPLFFAVDEEGGRVSRLPHGDRPFPSARKIGELGDPVLAFENGQAIGIRLQQFGFNLNFAPVLDIHSNPQNMVIGDRAFGDNAALVSKIGITAMQGMQSTGVIPTVKHFPGHGDTAVDSHFGLPVVEYGRERLDRVELVPFKEAIAAGAGAVMTAHILYPAIDDSGQPATMSRRLLTELLRREIGFDGVIITDDLEMGAIVNHFGIKEAALAAVKAGADILLVCHTYERQLSVLTALMAAVDSGELTEDRIDQSVYRIIRLKKDFGLF